VTQQSDDERRTPARAEGGDGVERELSRFLRPALEPAPDLADLFASVQTDIARERGLVAWLRSCPTALRMAMAYGCVVALCVATALGWLRPDIQVYPMGRMVMGLATMALLIAVGVGLVLRPLQRAALPTWVSGATVAVAVLALFAFYSLPVAHEAHPSSLQAPGVAALLARARPCVVVGLLLGAAVFAALRALDRGGARRSLLRAAAAGLCANLVLQLHCPNTARLHLLAGHFAVLVLLLAAVALWPRSARG
jgi:hypothetical protein